MITTTTIITLIAKLLFLAAGMTPPEVDVQWYTPEDCPHEYLATHSEGRIQMCKESLDILVHEMSHAWINQNVSEGQKDYYMTLFNNKLVCWNCDAPYTWRGTEHAAEMLRWHLTGKNAVLDEAPNQMTLGVQILLGGRNP